VQPKSCPVNVNDASTSKLGIFVDAKNAAGADTTVVIVSEETVVRPNVTEADKSAFFSKTRVGRTITESDDHIEAAQAVPILKRGLEINNLIPRSKEQHARGRS